MDYSSFLSVESASRKPSPLKALNLKCVPPPPLCWRASALSDGLTLPLSLGSPAQILLLAWTDQLRRRCIRLLPFVLAKWGALGTDLGRLLLPSSPRPSSPGLPHPSVSGRRLVVESPISVEDEADRPAHLRSIPSPGRHSPSTRRPSRSPTRTRRSRSTATARPRPTSSTRRGPTTRTSSSRCRRPCSTRASLAAESLSACLSEWLWADHPPLAPPITPAVPRGSAGPANLLKFIKEHMRRFANPPYEGWDVICTVGNTDAVRARCYPSFPSSGC